MKPTFALIALSLVAPCGEVTDATGPEGPPGPAGPTGDPGDSATVSVEPPGENCTAGGVRLTSTNGVSYVCHGDTGADGVDATAPVGSVHAYAGEDAQPGWFLCNGAAVSRATYAALFAVIGSDWCAGDGATTFNLPDMRGRFLRGTDRGAGRDPDAAGRAVSGSGGNAGDQVGSLQGDAYRVHSYGYDGAFRSDGSVVGGHIQGGSSTPYTVWGYASTTAGNRGSETRPVNVSVNYIVKH